MFLTSPKAENLVKLLVSFRYLNGELRFLLSVISAFFSISCKIYCQGIFQTIAPLELTQTGVPLVTDFTQMGLFKVVS